MKRIKADAATSARMAGIRQKETEIERVVALELCRLGVRYRKNVSRLPGSPDFANRSRRWAIFVNGCFWHHHTGCKKATVPKSNVDFWKTKFRENRARDARAIRKLRDIGYHVVLVWECQRAQIRAKLIKVFESRRINAR